LELVVLFVIEALDSEFEDKVDIADVVAAVGVVAADYCLKTA
jgi:hypothetical protein